MEYQRYFRVTYTTHGHGPWHEKREFRYFDDEASGRAFMAQAAARAKVEDRSPWIERVVLLKIEGEYYDVGGRCVHVVDRDGVCACSIKESH